MKIDFLNATQAGAVIGLGSHSVAVATLQPLGENSLLLDSFARPDVAALILTDEDDTAPIINEMKILRNMEPSRSSFFMFTTIPAEKRSSEVYELSHSPALCEDIEKTRVALRSVFNNAKLQLSLACFQPRSEHFWHTDNFKAPVALRPLSQQGTLILSSDEQSSAHAGQGRYVIKEKTMHSTPQSNTSRWLYSLLPV